jgi:uncharacterized protein
MPGCPHCGSTQFVWEDVAQLGTVVNITVVHARFNLAFEVPYALCVVALQCGARMVSRIVDCDPDSVAIGAEVRIVWEDVLLADTSIPAFSLTGVTVETGH